MKKSIQISEKTQVKFLLEGDTDPQTVFAYFPNEPDFDFKGNQPSYAHIGQHSGCNPAYAAKCLPATPEQYKDLKSELESIGYDLEIID